MRLHPQGTDGSLKSEWLRTLPQSYFLRFGDYLRDVVLQTRSKNSGFEQEKNRLELDRQLFIRMQQANNVFLPWATQTGAFAGKRVLEIGCGSGSCTVALGMASGSVRGLDILDHSVKAARLRCELLNVTNVSFVVASDDWLAGDRAAWPEGINLAEFDVIVCYALLEHLTIRERLNLLASVWQGKKKEAQLVIHETPNRFAFYDWHSTELNFPHILPDDLAAHYYRASPKRERDERLVKDEYTSLTDDELVRIYRWGRGVSYHEFDLAIGLNDIRVVNDGYSRLLAPHREKGYGFNRAYEEALVSIFDTLSPKVAKGFARASLDFVLESAHSTNSRSVQV